MLYSKLFALLASVAPALTAAVPDDNAQQINPGVDTSAFDAAQQAVAVVADTAVPSDIQANPEKRGLLLLGHLLEWKKWLWSATLAKTGVCSVCGSSSVQPVSSGWSCGACGAQIPSSCQTC